MAAGREAGSGCGLVAAGNEAVSDVGVVVVAEDVAVGSEEEYAVS